MAKLNMEISKTGVNSYKTDWFDPEGHRLRKQFELKIDADDLLIKVKVAKREWWYHDVFDEKKESKTTFNDLCALYVKNFGTQKAFHTSKRYLLAAVQGHFGDRILSKITCLDLQTYLNERKATPTTGSKPRTDSSVNREMALISHMLNKAVEWKLLGNSPFKKG